MIPTLRGVRTVASGDVDGDGTPELLFGDGWHKAYGKKARFRPSIARYADASGWTVELVQERAAVGVEGCPESSKALAILADGVGDVGFGEARVGRPNLSEEAEPWPVGAKHPWGEQRDEALQLSEVPAVHGHNFIEVEDVIWEYAAGEAGQSHADLFSHRPAE